MNAKILFAVVPVVLLMGCATNNADYARYVDSQKEMQVAKSIADSERYKAMAEIARNGSDTTKVAAMFAMQNLASGVANPINQITPPKSPWEIAREWAGLIVPAVVQGYAISANKDIATTQSNNSRDVAVSTNSTFATMNTNNANAAIDISTAGLSTAASIAGQIQAPAANITTTNTLSGTGVLGSGTYTPTTNTLSGTGVLGSGTYSPATTTATTTDSYNTPTDSYNTPTGSYNPVTNNNPVTTNPSTNPPVCAIDGTGALVCM